MHKALLWQTGENEECLCGLCHHRCRIRPDQKGVCQVRQNIGGTLYSLNYDSVCSMGVDPVEKKPLFHFQPGRKSFSIATMGCNFQCDFCQNWQISQAPRSEKRIEGRPYTPEQIVRSALEHHCSNIAYTYSEPTIFMELAADCGRLARQEGLANVFVSNGYMTEEALEYASGFLDGMNIDLKAFTEEFYRTYCKATLEGVLKTLRHVAQQTHIWLEVTTLIIPGLNDSDDELGQIAGFIAEELGVHIPWHISRYHPMYHRQENPPTPAQTLMRAWEAGQKAGLRYIYIGNLPGCGYENTLCYQCGHVLIRRQGYQIQDFQILKGKCMGCGADVSGYEMDPVRF